MRIFSGRRGFGDVIRGIEGVFRTVGLRKRSPDAGKRTVEDAGKRTVEDAGKRTVEDAGPYKDGAYNGAYDF